MYEIIKFSYKEFLRQTVNCELDVDSTCSILEQVDWVIFGKQIVLKYEMKNALRHMAVKGYNQLKPEEWNELNRKSSEDK
jgi:hypothetical protein